MTAGRDTAPYPSEPPATDGPTVACVGVPERRRRGLAEGLGVPVREDAVPGPDVAVVVVDPEPVDGLREVVERWRAAGAAVVVTPATGAVATAALRAGAEEALPPDEDLLLDRVRRHLDRARSTAAAAVRGAALEAAAAGVAVARLDDGPSDPVVHANPAFEALVGERAVSRDLGTVLGVSRTRGPLSDARSEVAAGRTATVEVQTGGATGGPRWTRLRLSPVRATTEATGRDDAGGDGPVTHVVLVATDTTERRRAARGTDRRADALALERAAVDDLLDRVEGVIGAMAGALIGADGRPAAERAVCERTAAADGYDGAWIGTVADDGTVTVGTAATAGGVVDPDSVPVPVEPVREAVATGEPRTVRGVADGTAAWRGEARARGIGAVAALPLRHEGQTRGVWTLLSARPAAFDERETLVLEGLARAVATAVVAGERRAILGAERVVEVTARVESPALALVGLARETGCKLSLSHLVVGKAGVARAVVEVSGVYGPALRAGVDAVTGLEDVVLTPTDAGPLEARLRLAEGRLLSRLATAGAVLTAAEVDPTGATLTVEAPDDDTARAVLADLEGEYGGVELAAYRTREQALSTPGAFRDRVQERLTERQLTALRTAHDRGYYDRPRRVDGDELAAAMGITRATFHQHLRAAQRKLGRAFLDEA